MIYNMYKMYLPTTAGSVLFEERPTVPVQRRPQRPRDRRQRHRAVKVLLRRHRWNFGMFWNMFEQFGLRSKKKHSFSLSTYVAWFCTY